MNILFLMKNYKIGGIEMVTQVLANKFYDEGHKVIITTFEGPPIYLLNQLCNEIRLIQLNTPIYSRKNIKILHNVLISENIDIVINQWGLPFYPTLLGCKAIKDTNCKYISVYHSCPNSNARITDIQIAISKTSNPIMKFLMYRKMKLFNVITSSSMRYVYNKSDLYIVLSESFKSIFTTYTGVKNANKLVAQTNPLTINSNDFFYDINKKKNEVIYVGRIDNNKSVSRIIETWDLLENRYPNWSLIIVGDGPEKNTIEDLAIERRLKNITFIGFCDPVEYYKKASILMLTSEYEGFPLVLAECMSFGVVPFVYGSFPSVYDIINSGENGIVLQPVLNGFDANAMAEEISLIISDSNKLSRMAEEAIKTSRFFSLDKIYSSWMELFNKVL